MEAPVFIPADPDQRRKLWREWVHTDEPRGERIIRRVTPSKVSNDWLPEVIDAPAAIIHGLRSAISECIIGGTLSITDRERLIARSIKLGLSRFDANLLIAAVQNRCRETAEPQSPSTPPLSAWAPRPMGWGIGKWLLLALFGEAVAAIAFYRTFL